MRSSRLKAYRAIHPCNRIGRRKWKKPFQASCVITVSTDTTEKDSFVATIKGVILTRFLEGKIVDFTHYALVQWPAKARFWLSRAYLFSSKVGTRVRDGS